MIDWADGYVADIGYTNGFYREMTPRWLATVATLNGRQAPDIDGPFHYLDLGCGQGFNAALLAAAYPKGKFWALDFSPAHIAHGQRLAKQAQLSNLELLEMSFEEFAASPPGAFPKFDFIALHGIYSWVNARHREAVVRILDRFLDSGGLAYVSYNAHPGWSAFQSAHRLVQSVTRHLPLRSDLRARQGLAFLTRLRDADAKSFKSSPELSKIIDVLQAQNSSYLAHELMNASWEIRHFADVVLEMGRAKLDYLGTANLLENFDALSLPAGTRAVVAELQDLVSRETVKDLARNQNFRRDIYTKGALLLTPVERSLALERLELLPLRQAAEGQITFKTPLGEATGKDSAYRPLVDTLARQGLTAQAFRQHSEFAGASDDKIVESMALLIASDYGHPAVTRKGGDNSDAARRKSAQRFNAAVVDAVLHGHDYGFLAAPDIGSGVAADVAEIVALGCLTENPRLAGRALAEAVWGACERAGRRFLRDGKPLETRQDNLEQVENILARFEQDKLLLWRRLGVL